MPYCSSCGVEVDDGVDRCPLCNASIHGAHGPAADEPRLEHPDKNEKPRLSPRGRRTLAWEVISILSAIAVFVVAASDLRVHMTLGWSLYPIIAIAWGWVVSTITIFAADRRFLIAGGWVVATLALLAGTNLLGGGLSWFVTLCLPMFALGLVVSVLLSLIVSRLHNVGLNVVSLSSIAAAVVCTGVDGVIEYYLTGSVRFSWSLIADEALLPFAAIMIFLHLRLRTRFNFRRIFHL